jgi:hypothetical protein
VGDRAVDRANVGLSLLRALAVAAAGGAVKHWTGAFAQFVPIGTNPESLPNRPRFEFFSNWRKSRIRFGRGSAVARRHGATHPAAIANAVYHATGKRVRDLPITLDKLRL